MDMAELAECSDGDLAEATGQVHAETALRAALCQLVAAFDARKAWADDGARSMPAWMAMSLGMAYGTAAEVVRVAHELEELPAVTEVFAAGGLSWDQVAALTKVATPETDAELAERGPGESAAQLRAAARQARPEQPDAPERSVRWRWDREGHWLRLWGRLPDADGVLVANALQRLADQVPKNPTTGTWDAFEARCADALVQLAGERSGTGADAERATVVVHVNASTLAGGSGQADTDDGVPVPADALRRMACNGRVEWVAETAGGTVGIGRARRQIPAWLGRYIRRRDQGCRFPGCGVTRWIDCHHVRQWADGGPTDASNIAARCGFHHRVVHREAWRIEGDPEAELCFVRPDGRPLPDRPARLRPDVAARLGIAPPDTS